VQLLLGGFPEGQPFGPADWEGGHTTSIVLCRGFHTGVSFSQKGAERIAQH
jgi:hypothetical protein